MKAGFVSVYFLLVSDGCWLSCLISHWMVTMIELSKVRELIEIFLFLSLLERLNTVFSISYCSPDNLTFLKLEYVDRHSKERCRFFKTNYWVCVPSPIEVIVFVVQSRLSHYLKKQQKMARLRTMKTSLHIAKSLCNTKTYIMRTCLLRIQLSSLKLFQDEHFLLSNTTMLTKTK